jgi:hypothetical protein
MSRSPRGMRFLCLGCEQSLIPERYSVRKRMLTVVLALLVAVIGWGGSKREFKTARLIDVTTEAKLVNGSSYRYAVFVVQIDDLIYTARGDRLGRIHESLLTLATTKPGDGGSDLIVGDPVQVSLRGDELVIRKPDGKELKTKVFKRARER